MAAAGPRRLAGSTSMGSTHIQRLRRWRGPAWRGSPPPPRPTGRDRRAHEAAGFFLNDPVFSEPNDSSVLLTLENSITSRVLGQSDTVSGIVGEEAYRTLNEHELSAVQIFYVRGGVTVKRLSEHLGRSVKVARSTLRGLVDKGVLSWHGSGPNDPSQHYSFPRSH